MKRSMHQGFRIASVSFVAAGLVLGCALGDPSVFEEEGADTPTEQVVPPLPPPWTFEPADEVEVRHGDDRLCVFANALPAAPGEGITQSFEEGDRLVVQVTYPECLSRSCDLDPVAACAIVRRGDTLHVEAHFDFVSVDDRLCTADCMKLRTSCESEPLEEGFYTVAFAERLRPLEIPSLALACAPACATDAECRDGFCGADDEGTPLCRPWAEVGQPCEGYAPPGMSARCAPGLACYHHEARADLPGTCVATCRRDADCQRGACVDGMCLLPAEG